ncbi:hypothetical protein QFC21_003521 [Naganishia friedmannii]|uniref:Uncharacterized protein n=1 Tax=Naganishia friedmannii TaxID=89922 RepID=A0ACC2VNI9_9TREE|nr:hypothetical protein QFC21_003521 [Naganishia friedmannii]
MNTGSSSSSGMNFTDDELVYLGGLNDQLSAYYRGRSAVTTDRAYAQAVETGTINPGAAHNHYDRHTMNDGQNNGKKGHSEEHYNVCDDDIRLANHTHASTSNHPMLTRQNVRENAVNEEEYAPFEMEFERDEAIDAVNTAQLVHNDGDDLPDWAVAFDAQNSPPFIPSELEADDIEEGNIMNNIHVHDTQLIQPLPLDQPFQPIRPVPPFQPVPALVLPLPAIYVLSGITAPKTAAEKRDGATVPGPGMEGRDGRNDEGTQPKEHNRGLRRPGNDRITPRHR